MMLKHQRKYALQPTKGWCEQSKIALQLSYEVPNEDKDRANKAIMCFDYLLKMTKDCSEYLNLIYTPFKDNQATTPEQIMKVRAKLRVYRDQVADKFNLLKRMAFKCFVALQPFSTDTQIIKLNKSFILSMGDIEKQVNRFIDLFSNFEAKDFSQSVVGSIDNIKKELAQLDQIVEDRIKDHLQTNILARNWVDSVSDELQEKVEQKLPFSVELVNERNQKLKGIQ